MQAVIQGLMLDFRWHTSSSPATAPCGNCKQASRPSREGPSPSPAQTQYSMHIAMPATRVKLEMTGRSACATTLLALYNSLRCRVRHPAGW